MQALSIVIQVLSFFATNREAIKQIILDIEALIPDAPGATKAAQVKAFIATAMGIETQVESAWPLISPIFNLFVGWVKSSTTVK